MKTRSSSKIVPTAPSSSSSSSSLHKKEKLNHLNQKQKSKTTMLNADTTIKNELSGEEPLHVSNHSSRGSSHHDNDKNNSEDPFLLLSDEMDISSLLLHSPLLPPATFDIDMNHSQDASSLSSLSWSTVEQTEKPRIPHSPRGPHSHSCLLPLDWKSPRHDDDDNNAADTTKIADTMPLTPPPPHDNLLGFLNRAPQVPTLDLSPRKPFAASPPPVLLPRPTLNVWPPPLQTLMTASNKKKLNIKKRPPPPIVSSHEKEAAVWEPLPLEPPIKRRRLTKPVSVSVSGSSSSSSCFTASRKPVATPSSTTVQTNKRELLQQFQSARNLLVAMEQRLALMERKNRRMKQRVQRLEEQEQQYQQQQQQQLVV